MVLRDTRDVGILSKSRYKKSKKKTRCGSRISSKQLIKLFAGASCDISVRSKVKRSSQVDKGKMFIVEKCVICYQKSQGLGYINCKLEGIQNIKFGRYGTCCSDKPICADCVTRCYDKCPFCQKHTLSPVTTVRYPKKKKPFAVREIIRKKKLLKKKKKKEKAMRKRERERRRERRKGRWENTRFDDTVAEWATTCRVVTKYNYSIINMDWY